MRNSKLNQKGSVVLEMLLGIALFIIVLPMLMSAIQERNKKLEEQAIASQINLIREAGGNYLSANKDKEIDGSFVIPENTTTIIVGTGSIGDDNNISLLSGYGIKEENIEGVLNGNSLGQVYSIVIDKEVTSTSLFTRGYLVVTKGDFSKLRLKRITNRIGFSAGVVRRSPAGGGSCTDASDYVLDTCVASSSGNLFRVPTDIYDEVIASGEIPAGDNEFIMVALSDGDVVVSEFLYKDKTASDNSIENTLLVNMNFSTTETRDDNNLYDVYTANVESITIDGLSTERSYFETISTGTLHSDDNIGILTDFVQYIEIQAENAIDISGGPGGLQNLYLGHMITQNLTFEGGYFDQIEIDKEISVEDLSLASISSIQIENLTMGEDENVTAGNFSDIIIENLTGYSLNPEGNKALLKLVGTAATGNEISVSGVNALEIGTTDLNASEASSQVGIVIQDTSSLDFTSDKSQLDIEELARINPSGDTNMVQDIVLGNVSADIYNLTRVLYPANCTANTNCRSTAVFNALYDMQKAMQYAHFCFEKDILQESVYNENCPLTRAEIVGIRDEIVALQYSTSISNISSAVNNLKNAVIAIDTNYWN